jgi:cytochrome bd-type quinol oxidase subunit 2
MQIIDIHMSIRGAVDDAIARTVAIGALVAIAVIHVLQLPTAFAAIGYLGALFIAAVAGCLALAAVMTRTSDDRAWGAAGGLAALILLCYVISRSVGLPGFTGDTGEWSEAPGLVSMAVEGLLVLLTAAVLMTRRMPMRGAADSPGETGASARGMRPGPAVG